MFSPRAVHHWMYGSNIDRQILPLGSSPARSVQKCEIVKSRQRSEGENPGGRLSNPFAKNRPSNRFTTASIGIYGYTTGNTEQSRSAKRRMPSDVIYTTRESCFYFVGARGTFLTEKCFKTQQFCHRIGTHLYLWFDRRWRAV